MGTKAAAAAPPIDVAPPGALAPLGLDYGADHLAELLSVALGVKAVQLGFVVGFYWLEDVLHAIDRGPPPASGCPTGSYRVAIRGPPPSPAFSASHTAGGRRPLEDTPYRRPGNPRRIAPRDHPVRKRRCSFDSCRAARRGSGRVPELLADRVTLHGCKTREGVVERTKVAEEFP